MVSAVGSSLMLSVSSYRCAKYFRSFIYSQADQCPSDRQTAPKRTKNRNADSKLTIDIVGILHRDLKPSNILLARRPTRIPEYDLCIGDFGIAWHADDPASEPADVKITDIGTTCYRAPELLFGCHNYKEGIDLWSAGCIIAEILMHNVRLRGGAIKRDWTLFDAGELGSELALVKSIFETLGTPNEECWPESKSLPDWGKMSFVEFPVKPWPIILPGADDFHRDVIAKLVQYQSTERISAQKVCDILGA